MGRKTSLAGIVCTGVSGGTVDGWSISAQGFTASELRIPLMADSDSIPIADSVPDDGGHAARVS
jgi:hypothetical protein